jgi:uncharacterized membrane protein YdjX (TVP38/TMEM64 family)
LRKALANRRALLLLAAFAAVIAVRFAGFDDLISLDGLRRNREALNNFVSGNFALASGVYVILYAAAVSLSLPGALIITLAGGLLFGAIWGMALTVFAATLGATLIFLFAKAIFGPDALERLGPKACALAANIKKNAWSYLLVLRLVPLFPFFLVNLIPAFVGVGLKTYFLTTFFGIITGTAVFSFAGAGLDSILAGRGEIGLSSILTPQIVAALVGLALLSLAAIPLKRRFAPEAGTGAVDCPARKEAAKSGRGTGV